MDDTKTDAPGTPDAVARAEAFAVTDARLRKRALSAFTALLLVPVLALVVFLWLGREDRQDIESVAAETAGKVASEVAEAMLSTRSEQEFGARVDQATRPLAARVEAIGAQLETIDSGTRAPPDLERRVDRLQSRQDLLAEELRRQAPAALPTTPADVEAVHRIDSALQRLESTTRALAREQGAQARTLQSVEQAVTTLQSSAVAGPQGQDTAAQDLRVQAERLAMLERQLGALQQEIARLRETTVRRGASP